MSVTAVSKRSQRYAAAGALVVSLFFLWGVANNLNDVLVAQFKKLFVLSDFRSGLVQSVFYFGYFIWAIPAALFMRRFGYKAGVIFGLALYAAGALLFAPAADAREYAFFLSALFVIASGLAFLETCANPLMTALGPRETAAQRLNFAQSFNSLGAMSGVLIGREFILSGVEPGEAELAAMSASAREAFFAAEAAAVKGPYLVLGLGLLALVVIACAIPFPPQARAQDEQTRSRGQFVRLLSERRLLAGVAAQFLYVGAQVGVWSYMIRYATYTTEGMGEKTAAAWLTGSLAAFMVGRFVSTGLMSFIAPRRLLAAYAICNVLLCFIAVAAPGPVGLAALAATSLFMSLMFPTIFALSIDGLGALTKAGSSLLVMAIIGGAIVTAMMGAISDATAINIAMLLPMSCFAGVFLFAAKAAGTERARS
ncbi:MAG: L-fucose:H+ symporter permease [Amphiplicatus sp.]